MMGHEDYETTVAPFAGAWIEMLLNKALKSALGVAPFAGAWIEIMESYHYWSN